MNLATAEELGIDVLDVLIQTFQLEGEVRKNKFHLQCPHPDHEDSNPSCAVFLETGRWNCFSCPAHGDIIDLGAWVLEKRKGEVIALLKPNNPEARSAAIHSRLKATRKRSRPLRVAKHQITLSVPGIDSYEDGPLTYLTDRGFTKKTLRRWGIRFAPKVTLFRAADRPFELRDAIAIPILSETSKVVCWCYRATDTSPRWFQEVRYIYTPDVQDVLNQTWFGLHLHKDLQEITVVEGALDAMWCDQQGIPALAILGSQVKQMAKVRKLMNFRKVTLLTDRDNAGVLTAYNVGTALQERGVGSKVCRYASWMLNRHGEPAKDAQDLCGLDLELVHGRAIPFLVWKQKGYNQAS